MARWVYASHSSVCFPIACLAAASFSDETPVGDEAGEDVGEAVTRDGAVEGMIEVGTSDGVLAGEEGAQGGVYLLFGDDRPHGQRILIHLEATQVGQQVLIRRETDAIDMDVAPHVLAILLHHPTAERQREGAESRQVDGRAVAHHVHQFIAHGVERSCHRASCKRVPLNVVLIHEFHNVTAFETRHQHMLARRLRVVCYGISNLLEHILSSYISPLRLPSKGEGTEAVEVMIIFHFSLIRHSSLSALGIPSG